MAQLKTHSSELKNDAKNKTLYLEIENSKAFVTYKKNKNIIKLIHSEVPEELRGKGFGKLLAKQTFDYVARNNMKMEISCEFLESYLEKYGQEYKKFLA